MYERGTSVLINDLHCPCHFSIIDLWWNVWFFYSSSSLFSPARRYTVSLCTPIIFQSKVHLQLWWNWKAASFRFSWAITVTCCPLLGILSEFLLPGFLSHCRCNQHSSLWKLSLSGLSCPCSLISYLAALRLNPCCKYIFWSHKAIILDPHAQCLCLIATATLWLINLWYKVPCKGFQFLHILHQGPPLSALDWLVSFQDPTPLVCSLHPAHILLPLCHLWHLLVPPVKVHWIGLRLFCVFWMWLIC